MPRGKKDTVKSTAKSTGKKSVLALARSAAIKVLKKPEEDWRVILDYEMLKVPLPHIPTGALVMDYLIGGEVNHFGIRPCPGLPRNRVSQIWGHESSGKCIPADTRITTPYGLLTVAEIFARQGLQATCTSGTTESQFPLYNKYGKLEDTTHLTHNNRKTTFTVRTFSGAQVRSTANHPHLVMSPRLLGVEAHAMLGTWGLSRCTSGGGEWLLPDDLGEP